MADAQTMAAPSGRRGTFLSLEGIDGCGKSTQAALLADRLEAAGHEVVRLREPGGTAISEKIRTILLDPENGAMADECELLLYEASRAQLVREVIAPALARGAVVVCDRYLDSTYAYQAGGRGLDAALVVRCNELGSCGVLPDRTLVLDLNCEDALAEEVDLVAAHKGSVEVDAILIIEGLQGLVVLIGGDGVSCVVRVREGAAVHVVDKSTGTLVTALACAVDGCHIGLAAVIDCLHCLQEILGGIPGVVLLIQVLKGVCLLKHVPVDCHTVGDHAQRILINLAVRCRACGADRVIQIRSGIPGHQIGEIHHESPCAPVGDQSLRSLEDQIRCLSALDGGVDLIVAVGVVEIFHGHLDAGILCIEIRDEGIDGCGVSPVSDRVGPERQVCREIAALCSTLRCHGVCLGGSNSCRRLLRSSGVLCGRRAAPR